MQRGSWENRQSIQVSGWVFYVLAHTHTQTQPMQSTSSTWSRWDQQNKKISNIQPHSLQTINRKRTKFNYIVRCYQSVVPANLHKIQYNFPRLVAKNRPMTTSLTYKHIPISMQWFKLLSSPSAAGIPMCTTHQTPQQQIGHCSIHNDRARAFVCAYPTTLCSIRHFAWTLHGWHGGRDRLCHRSTDGFISPAMHPHTVHSDVDADACHSVNTINPSQLVQLGMADNIPACGWNYAWMSIVHISNHLHANLHKPRCRFSFTLYPAFHFQ